MQLGFAAKIFSFLVFRDFWIWELQAAALFFISASKNHLARVGPTVCQKE